MIPGRTDHNGVRWERCTQCGDSKKQWKCHMMIDTRGSTYCFKCGHSSRLDIGDMIELMLGDATVDELLEARATALRNEEHMWNRGQLLTQHSIEGERDWVSYQMRDCNGNPTGWHNRNIRVKECDNEGRRGVGYVGDTLVSSPSRPLVVVEGPADVITPAHVCVFGALSAPALKQARLQYCWLQPDPDVIDTQFKRNRFAQSVVWPALDNMVFVQGVIIGNGDPDEATVLQHYSIPEVHSWIMT